MGIDVTSLKDSLFKEIGCGKLLLCQEKNKKNDLQHTNFQTKNHIDT